MAPKVLFSNIKCLNYTLFVSVFKYIDENFSIKCETIYRFIKTMFSNEVKNKIRQCYCVN